MQALKNRSVVLYTPILFLRLMVEYLLILDKYGTGKFFLQDLAQPFEEVEQQMESVCYLKAVRKDLCNRTGISACPVPGHCSYARMVFEPLFQFFSVPSIKQGKKMMIMGIVDDRIIALSLFQADIINADRIDIRLVLDLDMRKKLPDRFAAYHDPELAQNKRKGRIAEEKGKRKNDNIELIASVLERLESRCFDREGSMRTGRVFAFETSLAQVKKNSDAANGKKLAGTIFPAAGAVCRHLAVRTGRMKRFFLTFEQMQEMIGFIII